MNRWMLNGDLLMADEFNAPYYNALDQIYHVRWASEKLARFELVRRSIRKLWPEGHPTRFIQVAGTSGKGSVCRYIEAGLGLRERTGALVGPHMHDYRERFSVLGETVPQEEIVEAWEGRLKPLCIEQALLDPRCVHTFSEIYVLLALVLFDKHRVDRAVIETGIGGRYDQTTALDAEAAVLTNVGRDHQHLLGEESWQRALDKAGICRPGRPFFTSAQDDETLRIVRSVCRSQGAPLHEITEADVAETARLLAGLEIPEQRLLSGEYQVWNAALALKVIRHAAPELEPAAVLQRCLQLSWKGRFWKVADCLYADIAHNPDKIRALAAEIEQRFPAGARKLFVVGLSGERDAEKVFAPIHPLAAAFIVTTASYKGQEPESVVEALRRLNERSGRDVPITVEPEPPQAVRLALKRRRGTDVVILTGSNYMIDQALNPDPYLRTLNATYGWRNPHPEKP
jgi:dihydrofolate synthase/folylpolyglutamate synthase